MTRLIRLEDAALVAELLTANRDFLVPWDAIRYDDYYTADDQRQVIGKLPQAGLAIPR